MKNIVLRPGIWLKQGRHHRAPNAANETIAEALKKEESLPLIGFDTFEVRERRKHIGRNPKTREELKIKAEGYRHSKAAVIPLESA